MSDDTSVPVLSQLVERNVQVSFYFVELYFLIYDLVKKCKKSKLLIVEVNGWLLIQINIVNRLNNTLMIRIVDLKGQVDSVAKATNDHED